MEDELDDFFEFEKPSYEYILKIYWAWGLKEHMIFSTKEEALKFADSIQDDVDSCTIIPRQTSGFDILSAFDSLDGFYNPSRDWTDEEMDIYL